MKRDNSVFLYFSKRGILLILLGVVFSFQSQAQEFSFGVTAGLNFDLMGLNAQIVDVNTYTIYQPHSEVGFHGGLFFQAKINKFFLRPEVSYHNLDTEYDFPGNITVDYTVNKLSVPVLVGYNFYKEYSVFVGPVYQHIYGPKLENVSSLENHISPLAFQAGFMIEFGRFSFDIRYDHTFDTDGNQRIDVKDEIGSVIINQAYMDEGRLNQVLLTVSYKIFDTGSTRRVRGRGRSCYF